jgi:hypothetical protein
MKPVVGKKYETARAMGPLICNSARNPWGAGADPPPVWFSGLVEGWSTPDPDSLAGPFLRDVVRDLHLWVLGVPREALCRVRSFKVMQDARLETKAQRSHL